MIGLPIWYLTTTTYRASLPYDQVDAAFDTMQNIQFRINLEIVSLNDKPSASLVNDLNQKLIEVLNKSIQKKEIFWVLSITLKLSIYFYFKIKTKLNSCLPVELESQVKKKSI